MIIERLSTSLIGAVKIKIVVGMSGGVDSSVAAYLLKKQGHDVIGVFMQNWEDDVTDEFCTIKQDSIDAIAVADILGIDIEIINFAQEYKQKVFSYFLDEYNIGRTPNPDIFCNSEIKFKAFLEYALNTLKADCIATGHYVKQEYDTTYKLLKAQDLNKDQSYFLYRLNQHQISHCLFPLGEFTKSQIRNIATQEHLPNANKKDSTGICFIGQRPFKEFLSQYMNTKPGQIVSVDGKMVGLHDGLMYYTIGQRKGLGIGGLGKPWFVVDKCLDSNQLVVVQGHDHPMLYKKNLTASNLSFISECPIKEGTYTAKTRYRMQDSRCKLSYKNNDQISLEFESSQFAITSGQSVVIYDGNVCMGGGIID